MWQETCLVTVLRIRQQDGLCQMRGRMDGWGANCGLQERPTRPRVLWGESPLPSIARFRRLVYPGHGEVTNRGVLGSKSHGCPVLLVWNCGGSDLGGEQTWGPEHNEMTAASLTVPYWSRCAGKCGSRPSCNLGKADVLWEETGICTIGSHRGKGPGT